MNLQPCLGVQKIGNSTVVELKNDDNDVCKLLLKDGTEFMIPAKQSLNLSLEKKYLEKNKLLIVVKKEGRLPFTVHGVLDSAADYNTKISLGNENERPTQSRRRSSVGEAKKPGELEDQLVSTIEKLINLRLGNEDIEKSDSNEPTSVSKTPHALLSSIRKEAQLSLKIVEIKRGISSLMMRVSEKLKENSIRIKKEFVHDVGLKQKLLDLLVEVYNYEWLELGVSAVTVHQQSKVILNNLL